MSRNIIIVVVVLALVAGFFLLTRNSTPLSTTTGPENISTESASPSSSPASSSATTTQNLVTVGSAGYNPASITIKAGDTITWKNTDSANHTVNSDPHPTHGLYPILNTVGLLQPGKEKSATFTTAGTYTYHDHLNPSLKGTVTVQ
ncbi:MAG: cupredoxin domain-containing protein [Candidatus Daviesbacteria bacterium]|nr:cupredoxin domain-containing protein [Candidatus Daviesbacteria bacterium]